MNLKGKKVLLLGGTGAMGSHLSELLCTKGADVFVTSRSVHESNRITFIRGDAHDFFFLEKLLCNNEFDVLVDFMFYSVPEFQSRVNLLLSKVKHYIFLSSSRVYADSECKLSESSDRLLDVYQDKTYLGTDEYALCKAKEEDMLQASGFNNWTIIRPYITYSEQRLQLGVYEKEVWLYRALHNKTIVFSNDIAEKITTLTYGMDVAKGILSLMGEFSAFGKAFHITTNECNTWKEIFDVYMKVIRNHLGYMPKIIMQDKSYRLYDDRCKWQLICDRYYNRKFDNTNIMKYVDTSSFKGMKKGLEECLESFLVQPHFTYIDWREQAICDKITGEWTSLSDIPSFKQRIKYLLYRIMR